MRLKATLKLLLVGLLAWAAAWRISAESALEKSLYDFQQRAKISLAGPPTLPPELIVAAVDSAAYDAGMRAPDLAELASVWGPNAIDVTREELQPFLEADRDGSLRAIKLFDRRGDAPQLAPPLERLLRYQGVDPRLVRFEADRLVIPGQEPIKTDAEGRIYPVFPLTDPYSYSSKSGLLFNLLHPERGQQLLSLRTLVPISIPDLLRKRVETQDKLVLLGMYLPEADKIEYVTPGGDMVRLELYASVIGCLLTGDYLRPLPAWQSGLLSLFYLTLLAALLQRQSTTASVLSWTAWSTGWLALHQALQWKLLFGSQSPVLLAGLFMLLLHLLQRSWRVNNFLSSLGGRAPLERSGEELEATIMFTNLPDLVKEWEESDPVRAHAAREAHSKCVGYVVHRHGGRLVDLQGDSQMIAFGLEGGNHRQQAAACATELVEKVNLLLDTKPGESSQAYCGIVTGPVATGRVGGGQYYGVAAIGDTTNSSARLLGKAKASGKPILVSEETISVLGLRAEAEPVGELTVKGRSMPLKVWELTSFTAPIETRHVSAPQSSRRIPKAVFLVTAILSLLIAARLSRTDYFYNVTLDWVTPTSASAPVIFAGLDESSLEFHEWPWPRGLHAQVIENCREAGAKIIFLDFLFEDPSTAEHDRQLAEAVLSTPQAVLAAAARTDGQEQPIEPKLLPSLYSSGQWGLINHAPRNGSQALRHALWQLESAESGSSMPGVSKKVAELLEIPRTETPEGQSDFPFRWGPKPLTVSYQRLLDPSDPIFEKIKGSVVVAGDNLPGRSDAFETPYGTLKGATLHALSIQTLLSGGLLRDVSASSGLIAACGLYLGFVLWRSWGIWSVSGQCLVLLSSVGIGVFALWSFSQFGLFLGFLPVAAPAVASVLGWVLSVADSGRALTGYIPRRLQEKLETEGGVADVTTVGTILLTDIRGYTTLSEGRAPSEVLALLNDYHEKTAAVYQEYGGHLITYQGDAQIVVFGPLEPIANPVLNAVQAARRLPQIVNEVARAAGLNPADLRVGCGITTGNITLSLMGAREQMQYSVFGAPVRKAHHLQSLSDLVERSILLDPRSRFAVKESVSTAAHRGKDGERFFSVSD